MRFLLVGAGLLLRLALSRLFVRYLFRLRGSLRVGKLLVLELLLQRCDLALRIVAPARHECVNRSGDQRDRRRDDERPRPGMPGHASGRRFRCVRR